MANSETAPTWTDMKRDRERRAVDALETIASLLEQILDNGIGIQPRCVHGNVATQCHSCDVSSDFAYDAAREDRR